MGHDKAANVTVMNHHAGQTIALCGTSAEAAVGLFRSVVRRPVSVSAYAG